MNPILHPIQTIGSATRTVKQTADTLNGYARTALYAGLGVVAIAQEEAEKAFNQFVSEGRAVEAGRAKTHTAEVYATARQEAGEAQAEVVETADNVEDATRKAGRKIEVNVQALEERVALAVNNVLQRMNVPTREDVESLKRSVERLDKKSTELRGA